MLKFISTVALLCASISASVSARASTQDLDLEKLRAELKSTAGLSGWVHASVSQSQLFVFTYREPGNFFNAIEFSMIPDTTEVARALAKLRRHDQIALQGDFADNPSAQKHIVVTGVRVIKAWDGEDYPPYEYPVVLPDDLRGRDRTSATVHAVAAGGRVLLVEYKHWIVPVFVEDPTLTAPLYRGDRIDFAYEIQEHPTRPTHLRLKTEIPGALKVLERIVESHGQTKTLAGYLVRFPQSPQIVFDIYALRIEREDGSYINYTLVNFEDADKFREIREKLAALWASDPSPAENGRNCWIKRNLRVQATGTINVVSPNQANPQILLESKDSVRALPQP